MPDFKSARTFIPPLRLHQHFAAFRAWHGCLFRFRFLWKIKCDLPFFRQFQRCIKFHTGLCHKSRYYLCLLFRQKLFHLRFFQPDTCDTSNHKAAAFLIIFFMIGTHKSKRCHYNIPTTLRALHIFDFLWLYIVKIKFQPGYFPVFIFCESYARIKFLPCF